ncbi:FecR family protein [Belliella kenyensis]|uniref:FecR family protein n=1 Tax=Belliella kenyensis TaxID=1472724 RepID=A0ABV8ESG4_9BACT|nr:FecR domain-containing protein [Belliella kenyensis]MCH7402869.1 FecR domain-containing protein [Belliella kenyensis]MDN3602575.1 FecR domain-containing protein [Belliella kenyensis]
MTENKDQENSKNFKDQYGKFLPKAFKVSTGGSISPERKEQLFERIVDSANQQSAKASKFSAHWLKYAAVLVGILVVAGSAYFGLYRYSGTHDYSGMLSQLNFEDYDQAQLIINDQETILLEGEASVIDYQNDAIVVNKNTTASSKLGEYNTLIIPYGKRSQVSLPDGSKVYLNSGSKMVYPTAFASNRHIYLEGEAYFEVFRDEANPFTVQTKDLSYRVLGTSFNVNAYDNNDYSMAVLVTGSIEVKSERESLFKAEKRVLKPNQQLNWSKNAKTFEVNEVNVEPFVSWKDGYLIFEEESIRNISKRLEKLYNVEIAIGSKILERETFTGRLDLKTDIEQVLGTIASTSGVSISKKGRRYEFTRGI